MKWCGRLVVILLVANVYAPAHASAKYKTNTPTYFRHVSVSDGLSQVTVSDILEDKSGFIWFATQNGINRYDGYNFIQFKKDKRQDGSGPIGEFAYKLAPDPNTPDIWIATSGGLSRYQYQTNTFKHYNLIGLDGRQRFIVSTVVVDRNNQVWAGTRQGVFKYDVDKDLFVPVQLDISSTSWVLDIARDSSGDLLVATSEGLFSVNENNTQFNSHALIGEQVTDIERLESNEFWISTARRGILRKPDGTAQLDALSSVSELSSETISAGVNSIKQLRNGDIWLSSNIGLNIIDHHTLSSSVEIIHDQQSKNLLSAAHLTRTFESQSGLVWQGTWTSGFSIFDPNSLQMKSLNATPFSWVRGMGKDEKDNIWFGTPAGIWKKDTQNNIEGPWLFPSEDENQSNASQSISRSIAFDATKQLFWVGTTAGLFTFSETTKQLLKKDILTQTNIFFVDIDEQGDLWVGTFNEGLYRIDSQTLSIKAHWGVATVTHIFVDDENFILAGTIEGLIYIDKSSNEQRNLYHPTDPKEQRSPRVVTWISEANDGEYWLGTQGSGVFKMTMTEDTIRFSSLTPGAHLASLSVGGVQQDDKGDLWVSTTEGIAQIELKTLNVQYFNRKNGAFSEGYYINHSVKTNNGEIFFGGPKGMSHFLPENISLSSWKPEVVFTKLLVLNKPIEPVLGETSRTRLTKHIHIATDVLLGPADNVFSLEFSALDYAAPDDNQYAYKLEGFDVEWNTAIANHRVATYTNLDPGRYTLFVKGTNKDGIWSDKVANLEILVIPPWYWNSWSKTLWFVLAVLAITAIYRWRIWSLQLRSEELSRLVEKRTRDLEDSNRKLLKLSSIDELTGLRNRRDFRIHAEKELHRFNRYKTPFTILMFDIDDFKQINDQRGHACGDAVLAECANVMKGLIRKYDLLARWGGEEFILLAVNTDLKASVLIAEKIRTEMEQRFIEFNAQQINVTVTIGVSEIQLNQTLDDCINMADKKMYEGKRSGRNQTSY